MLSAAFPKIGAAWLAPLGAAALFWAWQQASWKRAFWVGWFAGAIFFTISCWWWSTTIATFLGVFAYIAVILGASYVALSWGLAGALVALAFRYARPALAPLAAALAFVCCEWLRSVGVMGMPFAQLGYTQSDTPLRIFAAYLGTCGVTLAICVFGAYLADALHRRTLRPFAIAFATLSLSLVVCWIFWPARSLPPPNVTVAAIQGNIAQSLKWNSLPLALDRYTSLTREVESAHPKLILWPETVIPTILTAHPELQRRFATLATQADTTLVVGSQEERNARIYNALYLFVPGGGEAIYEKRQLVPFAESFPGRSLLSWLPYASDIGGFAHGTDDTAYRTTSLAIAPLICWESAFSDLAHAQLARGAQVLAISTDDAWFGTSSGPYQHAQIAQLRAVESGAYVVRAAATGISGIVAPNGDWTERAPLDTQAAIVGKIGPPVGSPFANLGPTPVVAFFGLAYAALILRRKRHAA